VKCELRDIDLLDFQVARQRFHSKKFWILIYLLPCIILRLLVVSAVFTSYVARNSCELDVGTIVTFNCQELFVCCVT